MNAGSALKDLLEGAGRALPGGSVFTPDASRGDDTDRWLALLNQRPGRPQPPQPSPALGGPTPAIPFLPPPTQPVPALPPAVAPSPARTSVLAAEPPAPPAASSGAAARTAERSERRMFKPDTPTSEDLERWERTFKELRALGLISR